MPMLDVQEYYKKLANNEPVSSEEIQDLLKAYKVAMGVAAYLASCHAATAEGLTASTPLSAKKRMWSICNKAVEGLGGTFGTYRAETAEAAKDRCQNTVDSLGVEIRDQEAATAQRAKDRKAAKPSKSKKAAP